MSKPVNLNVFFPEEEMDNQWIIDLIACLRFACQKVIGDQVQCSIKTTDLQKVSDKAIVANEYFIAILGSNSNDNEQFQKSLSYLCDHLLSEKQNPVLLSRLFKILLKPNQNILQPERLKPYIGYEFFDYSLSGRETKLYEINTQDVKIWSIVLDIIYDLKQTFQTNEGISGKSQYAYLANCSLDQKAHHHDIRRELQHFNIRVLPTTELPEETDLMKSIIEMALEQCSFVVQVVGERYGKVRAGDKISIFEKENNIILDYLKNHSEKFRLIWKPTDLKLTDSRQNLYLNRLMKDGTSSNSKVIDASLNEFKDMIATHINTPGSVFDQRNSLSDIYLMYRKSDDITQLEKAAVSHHIEIIKEHEDDQGLMYLDHLKNLKTIPNLAIFYSGESTNWLNSKLGDIIKVIGMGRDVQLKSLVILGTVKPQMDEYLKWLPNIEFFNIHEKEALDTFFKKCN